MRRPVRVSLVAAAAIVYLLLHVATLTRSPVPYFDDTFFASVGESFARTGELKLPVAPLWMDGPVYLYGPVYFVALRSVFAQYGFGILQNRVLGLGFGLGLVLVTFAVLRRADVRRDVALPTCLLMALDPTFNLSLHSGRMDDVALFFILGAFWLLQTGWRAAGTTSLLLSAASGLVAGVAVLTTPRPGYLVVVMGAILALRWMLVRSRERALQLVCWVLPLVGLYLLWIAYAFGSVAALAAYYGQFAGTYVGGHFIVRPVHYPLLAALAVVGALRLALRRSMQLNELVAFALTGIVAFYALGINPPGFGTVYTVLTIPLVYMAIARLAQTIEGGHVLGLSGTTVGRTVFALLLVVNVAVYAARTALEMSQWSSRDPAPVERLVREVIPPGSKVIGDDKFYYAVVAAGSDYQYWRRGGTVAERVAYQTDRYAFDYLVTNEDPSSELFAAYAARNRLTELARIEHHEPSPVATWLSSVAHRLRVGAPMVGDYEGAVFMRGDRVAEQR